jgi:flagellar motor switch protein FliN/FliY
MMPSDIDQSENGPEGAEFGFDQATPGLADFSDGQSAGITEVANLGASDSSADADGSDFGAHSAMIMGLPVMMKVVLGSAKMPVATLAKLAKGSVVKLDKMVGDPVDILINGRLIARGEVVVLNEGSSRFGVVLTQVGSIPGVTK